MRTCCAKNLLLLAFISGGCFLPSSVAQVVVRRGPQKAKVPVSRLPADRKMEGWLRRASEAYARKDWALAVAFCQKILESGRTAYITREEAPKVLARLAQKETAKPPAVSLNINPSKAHPSTPSVPVPEDPGNLINLEQAARWLLFNMPEAGRELYRAQYSGLAEQKLAMARKENDVFALSRVWSMYPLTPSAWGAANRLGTHLLEQGKLLLAVKEFEKLIQHPEFSDLASPEMLLKLGFAQITLGRDAKDTMQLYASTFAGRLASAGGDKRSAAAFFEQTWELPDLPVSVARDWPSFLGSEKRNVIATTTPPFLDPVWSFRLGEIPGFPHEKWNSMLAARRRSTDRALPAMYPVARAGRIFFKSLGGIVALDARTGHKLWESAEYPGALSSYLAEALKLKSEKHASLTANLISWLQTAVFMDVTEFSIAAGEMNVISVNRVFPKSQISGSTVSTFVPSQAKQNQIAAFDIQTGRVKWRIFGGDNEDLKSAETVNSREFKNTFFLGAPTIHQGKVFVMGDSAGEVSLFVLRESDGSLLRRISLCLSQPAASEVAERRQDACPVTIHEGIALCPTQVGRLFAVAAHSGEILWTASYPRSTNPMPRSVYRTQRLLRRQVVAAPIVSGERVFFLPADGDRVLCLDLQTGRLIWKHLVDHEHVLAAVNSDRALVIGWDRKAHALHVDCLKIQDGIALKNNGTVHIDAQRSWLKPGGRGLLADHQYLLPIDGKRLVNIDLKTAKTTLVVKTALEYPPAVLPESRIPLPEQWRFTILKFKEDWTTPEFDDSGWRVTSPTVLLSHLGFTNFKGTVRYRVPFTATRADGPSRLVLSFGSLPQDSKIYINGRLVSSSKASAEQTDFDITGIYQPNRENLLALEVRTSSVHRLSVPFLHWQDRLNTRRELGNLIAHRGMVISAGPEGLDAYPQMKDVSESLQQRLAAKDPEAEDLLLMAKLHLNLGKDHEAEASIRKAQRLEARATIKEELRRALFQALLNQARKKPDSRVFQEALSLALTQREKYEVLLHLIDFHQAAGKGVQAVRIARELALSNPNHFVVLKDGRNIRADVW
ncbi:MAG: PQQ-binding-like beta-propeller repeat protein, partial [Planctomycetota bacterium]|nr:PQQ-binding-like beta-propeller repeat protein [Planctomycetota bacterium]